MGSRGRFLRGQPDINLLSIEITFLAVTCHPSRLGVKLYFYGSLFPLRVSSYSIMVSCVSSWPDARFCHTPYLLRPAYLLIKPSVDEGAINRCRRRPATE